MDFGLDSAHQWDTKRELFHLAEVGALPSAILLCAVLPSCHSMSDFWPDPKDCPYYCLRLFVGPIRRIALIIACVCLSVCLCVCVCVCVCLSVCRPPF